MVFACVCLFSACFLLVLFAWFWHGGCLFVCLCLVWCVLVLLLGFAMASACLILRALGMGFLTLSLGLLWCLLVLLLRFGMGGPAFWVLLALLLGLSIVFSFCLGLAWCLLALLLDLVTVLACFLLGGGMVLDVFVSWWWYGVGLFLLFLVW